MGLFFCVYEWDRLLISTGLSEMDGQHSEVITLVSGAHEGFHCLKDVLN